MGVFLLIVFAVAIVLATMGRLQLVDASRYWWMAFALMVCIGGAVGGWSSLVLAYQYGPDTRVAGFPFPIAVFKLEHGQWTDYVFDLGFAVILIGLNVLICVSVFLLPVLMASSLILRMSTAIPGHLVFRGKMGGLSRGVSRTCEVGMERANVG